MKLPGIQYTSPREFSAKQRFILATVPPLAANLYKYLGATCSREVRGEEFFEGMIRERGSALLALWHETTGILACLHQGRNFHSTASYSFDGELAARAVHCFGAETVRGSSSNGGSEALREMEKVLGRVPAVGITLDGPRGPRRVAKAGIAILSARTGTPIVPNAAAITRCWRTRSWDEFIIPKPFAHCIYAYGTPVPPPHTEHPDDIEVTRAAVEKALNALHAEIEQVVGYVLPPPREKLGAPRSN